MIRYHVFYKRTNGLLDCLDIYANDIGEAFKRAEETFKDHNFPVEEILEICKKNYLTIIDK